MNKEILTLIIDTLEAISKSYNHEATINIIKLKSILADMESTHDTNNGC